MPRQSTPEQLRINVGRDAARRAVFSLALASALVSRCARGGPVRDLQPLAVARELEHGTGHGARAHVLAARQTGHAWHDTGIALNLAEVGELDPEAETTVGTAFTCATGIPGTRSPGCPDRVFSWRCRSGDRLVSGHGPRDGERVLGSACPRLIPALRLARPGQAAGQ